MPRAKRAKQYRKLMEQFSMGFGFREPYQCLVDAALVVESVKCKMDLTARLESTVSGKVKPMITQCSMRHLYAQKKDHAIEEAIELAKSFERRRCGHHPDDYPEPLSTLECVRSVVDPKDNRVNKHRYIVASNELEVRAALRMVRGVPLIYITRSVMILEPMADATAAARAREEKEKFRAEIKTPAGGKRKREDESDDDKAEKDKAKADQEKKRKKKYGTREPNPLSVKKAKKKTVSREPQPKQESADPSASATSVAESGDPAEAPKKKRKRKYKAKTEGDAGEDAPQASAELAAAEGPAA